MVSTLCKRPWSCPSQEAKEALRPFGCRAPFNPNFPSTRLRTSPSSSPTSSSSSHLSILELLKATIGLHSGPWSLPISNTSVVRLSTAREVWNETEPWRRYPVGFSRPSSTAFVADLDKRYLVTADHVLASHFRITASRAGLAEGEGYRARVLCRAEDWDLALLTVDEDAFWSGVEAAPLNAQVTCRPDSFVTVAGFYNKSLTTDEWMVQDYALGPSCLNLNLYRNGHSGWGGRDGPAMPFGCSGGPVFAQTKGLGWSVVGMLSAGQPDRAILHTVPAHLIQKMIRQYEAHGQFVGGSSPSFKFQRLLNPYLRESLGMGVASSGVLITEASFFPPSRLAVDDQGVISLPPDRMQVDLRGLWDLKEDGQELTAKVLREGRVVQLKGPTKRVPPVVPISSASVTPPRSYVLVGGLLFLPASQTKVVAHQARINQAPVETQLLFKAEPREHPEEEYVLLWRIYPHEINEGYQERLARLLKFNGVPVKNLAHLEVKQGRERVKGMGARRVAFLMLSSVLAHWMARPRPTWQFTYSDSY
ncbi:trypsin family [Nannochloropsis gaditana]|uniref:Trypsin family n=1 Tax=Nannochloropsis gaditana TaxID=72520 RepID=W7TA96_9STRA|nr:trypsin family [Nannochloropsis gaditana]EWM20424.1 trypsin family [Nannochloropsis gaditana]